MEYHLLIDDMRTIKVDEIARTVEEGKAALLTKKVTHLYLDNDLGDDQPMEGIDILYWARDNDLVPPNVFIISANSVCRKRMEDVFHFDLQYKKEGNWWKKTTL